MILILWLQVHEYLNSMICMLVCALAIQQLLLSCSSNGMDKLHGMDPEVLLQSGTCAAHGSMRVSHRSLE